jgi:hypothetical protein
VSGTRWEQAADLFHRALEQAPAERDAFLHDACNGDEDLYREVVSLIAADQSDSHAGIERLGEAAAADWVSIPGEAPVVGRQIGRYTSSRTSARRDGRGLSGDRHRARTRRRRSRSSRPRASATELPPAAGKKPAPHPR